MARTKKSQTAKPAKAPEFSPEAQAAKENQQQKDTMRNVHAGPGGF